MKEEIAYSCLVGSGNIDPLLIVLNDISGFSRGAYQIRVLSAMIDKVSSVSLFLIAPE